MNIPMLRSFIKRTAKIWKSRRGRLFVIGDDAIEEQKIFSSKRIAWCDVYSIFAEKADMITIDEIIVYIKSANDETICIHELDKEFAKFLQFSLKKLHINTPNWPDQLEEMETGSTIVVYAK